MAYFADPTPDEARRVCQFFARLDPEDIDIICGLFAGALEDECIDGWALSLARKGRFERAIRGLHQHLTNMRERMLNLTPEEFAQIARTGDDDAER